MPHRLPRQLILGFAYMTGLSLFLSMLLEQQYPAYLQTHPITVNLISSVVAFATGILTVSVVWNWYQARSTAHERMVGRWIRHLNLEQAGKIVCSAVPDSYYGRSAPADSERKETRCRDLVEASKRLWNLEDGDPEDVLRPKVGGDPLDPRDFAALITEVEAYLLDYVPFAVSSNLAAYPTMNFWRRRAARELEHLVQLTAAEAPDPSLVRTATLFVLSALANVEELVYKASRHDDEHLLRFLDSQDVVPRNTETPLARVPPVVEFSELRAKGARLKDW